MRSRGPSARTHPTLAAPSHHTALAGTHPAHVSRHTPARRLATAAAGLAVVFALVPAVTGIVPGSRTPVARADDQTASLTTMRDGWDPSEPNLSPATVATFNPLPRFYTAVTGQVFAQPLVIDKLNLVVVATEDDWVYGITATGAGAGTIVWSKQLGTSYALGNDPTFKNCTDLVPNIGVTGTPVYDPANGDVYMFANIVSSGTPQYYLVGINPSASGAIVQKTLISGHPSNDSHISFSGKMENQRPGVLLSTDGGVWAAFASHCDYKPYAGYVVRVDLASQKVSLWTDESGTTYNQGGIWHSGGGVMQDTEGRIFVVSGNGISPPKTNSAGGQLAESVIRLGYTASTNQISARGFFSPANAPSLDASDTDFGSSGAVGLPFGVSNGTTVFNKMLAAVGKDGRIFVLDRNNLGGRQQGPNSSDNDLALFPTAGGAWGHPAAFADTATVYPNTTTANDFLFNVSMNSSVQVLKFGTASNGHPTMSDVANSSLVYGFGSGSPVVTSNGTDPTTAVVWEVYTPGGSFHGAGSELVAYQLGNVASTGGTPSPCTSSSPCTLTPIWNSATFSAAKFSIPATDNGWVYVGAYNGHVLGYSTASGAAAAGPVTTFAPAQVGSATSADVAITASHPVTVTGVPTASTGASNASVGAPPATSAAPVLPSQFAVGVVSKLTKGGKTPVPVSGYPVHLDQGDKLIAHVTLTPAAPGTVNGVLSFPVSASASTAAVPAIGVAMTGTGTKPGLTAPGSVSFPLAPDQGVIAVPVGIVRQELVSITNYGTSTQTVTSVTPPAAPFSAAGLPSLGTQIRPGQAITVHLAYAPASAVTAQDSRSFTITSTGGGTHTLTVTLLGSAAAPVSQFTVTPGPVTGPGIQRPGAAVPAVNFGAVRVGTTATGYIYVSNTGNTAATIGGTAPPPTPFGTPLRASPGLPVSPGSDLALPVTFAPVRTGAFTAHYRLTWHDVNGTHLLTVTLTGTGA